MATPILRRVEENKAARVTIKILLVLFATFGSTVFFGVFVPFFVLAMEIVPSLGVGGVIYFFVGALFGLLFGAISTTVSLARSQRLVTRYYVWLVGVLVLLSIAYVVCWVTMQERFAHV